MCPFQGHELSRRKSFKLPSLRNLWPTSLNPWQLTLTVLLLSLEVVWDLTFFDLWPLFRRSDEEITVAFYLSLTKINTLTLLLLSFHVVCDLTFFDLWPLNHRPGEEVNVDTFWCLTPTNALAVLVLPSKIVQNLTPFFDLSDLKWPQVKFWKTMSSYFMCMNNMIIMNNIE